MYFNLNKGIDIVKGKKRNCIIDTNKYALYDISEKFYKILNLCAKGKKIEAISNDTHLLISKLHTLEELQIGRLTNVHKKNKKTKIDYSQINMVWLPVTEMCNYKCVHCYENAKKYSNEKIISLQDYQKFFDALTKKHTLNCVQITGGEPLLRGKSFIKNLIKLLRTYKIKTIEIFSNLSLIDQDYINIFKKYNISIATSIYSQNRTIHDNITGIKGSHKKTISSLELLQKNKIPFRIGIVIMNKNKEEKSSLRNWLNTKFSIEDKKNYDIIRPIGRAKNFEHIPQDLFQERYVNSIRHISKNNFYKHFYNKVFNSCWGDKICLKSNGELYPCVMSKFCLGNYKNVSKILDSKKSYRFLNKDKIKICNKCELRYLCEECRAMYSNSNKNIFDKPFTCSYNPTTCEFDKGGKNENKN